MRKKKTVSFIEEIMSINDLEISSIVKKLESLDQDKTYWVIVPGVSNEELNSIKKAFQMAANRVDWTVPTLIFINKKIFFEEKDSECEK